MRSLRLVVAAVCVLSVPALASGEEATSPIAAREGLLLERGTLELGGGMIFQAQVATSTGDTVYQAIVYPSIGYFVADRLELEVGAGLSAAFAEGYSWTAWWNASVGARYHFVVGERVTLYAGLRTGLGGQLGEGTDARLVEVWFAAPMGLLLGLNRHVAVELGLQPTVTVFPQTGAVGFTASVGYTGVRAYF